MMQTSLKYREGMADVRRVVVKIGTRVLVRDTGRPDERRMHALAAQIAALRKRGLEMAMVTSGAIGAGIQALGMQERPELLPELQMAAAVGQCRLMAQYDRIFSALGIKVGQVLLTRGNFRHKVQLTNARRTLEALLRRGVIPIINENDVVANEEIRAEASLGDNDYLASLLVKLIRADLLVLLTTADGLREPGSVGRTRRVRYLESITPRTFQLVTGETSRLSRGGMVSKLKSAREAARAGCTVVIADGRKPDVLTHVLEGRDIGTVILASAL